MGRELEVLVHKKVRLGRMTELMEQVRREQGLQFRCQRFCSLHRMVEAEKDENLLQIFLPSKLQKRSTNSAVGGS